MYNLLAKRGQLFAFVIGGLISLIFLITALNGGAGELSGLPIKQQIGSDAFNFGLKLTMFLVVLCFALWFIFSIVGVFTNLKSSLKGLIAFGGIAVIFFIIYGGAGADAAGAIGDTIAKFNITENVSKFISGGIGTGIALTLIAGVGFILFELVNLFR